jgi:selenocysteine lyase/cysteine desulfurase
VTHPEWDAGRGYLNTASVGIKAATRAGSVRVSFHVYDDDEDVGLAVAALGR